MIFLPLALFSSYHEEGWGGGCTWRRQQVFHCKISASTNSVLLIKRHSSVSSGNFCEIYYIISNWVLQWQVWLGTKKKTEKCFGISSKKTLASGSYSFYITRWLGFPKTLGEEFKSDCYSPTAWTLIPIYYLSRNQVTRAPWRTAGAGKVSDEPDCLLCCKNWGNSQILIETYHKIIEIAHVTVNSKTLDVFPLRLRTRQGCLLFSFLFNIALAILASATRQEKEIKCM